MKQINKLKYFKTGLMASMLFFSCMIMNAQVNSYSFAQSSGTYTEITGGTIVATATGTSGVTSLDDVIYDLPAGTIPYTFTFDNIGYTGCKISTNGFITFGATAPAASGSTTGYAPLSAVTAYSGAISALGRNLNAHFNAANAAQTGELRYQVLGSSPNRIFVVQFKNWKTFNTGSTAYTSVLNFQIRLSETTNAITMVYNCSGTFASSLAQVGLRGSNNTFPTNINNRSVANATNTWITSTAGTINTSSCEFLTGFMPPAGLTYTFTPSACPAPQNLAVTNVTQTAAQLIWTTTGGGGTFKVEYGLSGFTPGTGTVINNAVSPLSISGLAAATNYGFYVQQNCGGAGTSPNTGPFTFQSGGPGEDCSSAILVTVKTNLAACGYTTVTSGVSQNGPNAVCSDATGNVADDDRWLKFVAPSTGNKLVIYTTAGTINDWTMQVWKACGGNPADVVKCADDDNAFMPQITLCQNEYIPGQTYYIRAWTYSHGVSGTMNLCIYQDTPCPIPPSNDECNVASSILVNQSGACPANAATFTTKDATASGFTATCDASTSQRDVFLTFNTDIYGDIKITFTKLTATNLKAQLLFDCAGGELFCWNPADGAAKTITGLNPNADYILRIWSDSTGAGTFTVCMSDACSNPTATISGTQSICSGGMAQLYVDFTGSAPFTFSYTDGTTTTPVVTSNNPYSLLVSPTTNKTYSLVSMSDATCSGTVSGSAVVTIATPPTVTLANFTPVCSNAGIVSLTGGSPAGGTYSGTGVSGGSFNPTVGTQTITYSVSFGIGCNSSASKVLTVNAAPTVTLANFTPVCSNAGLITLTGGSPVGGTYTGANVSAGKFNPSGGDESITYTYTNASGCSNSATKLFTVNAAPLVQLTAFNPVCSNTAAFTLTTGGPSGGIYTGTGVSGGIFNPATAGVGTFIITYSFTNASGCTASDTSSITVNAAPTVTLSSFSSKCLTSTPFTLTGGSPIGGTYSGTGVSGGVFNPASSGVGTFVITYSYTNASGCSGTASSSITVNANPTVTLGAFAAVCSNATPFTLTGGSPTGGTYSGTGVSGGIFNPATAGVGTFVITYSYTNGSGCSASASASITVNNCGCNPPLTGAITGSIGICVPVNGQAYSVPSQAGVTFTWTVPANVTIATGQGTNAITTNWGSTATTGTVCVVASNACGSSLSTCKTVTKRTALPAAAGVITGSTNGCPGDVKLYTIRKVATADDYTWTPPTGCTINGSSSPFTTVDTMVNVTFTAGFPAVGDTLRVSASNCKGTSAQRKLKIGKAAPATPGVITGQATALCNKIGVVYSIAAVVNAASYTWSTAIAGVTINGNASPYTTTSTTVTLNFGVFTTGTLIVTATNGCGTSANRTLTLNSKPATPGIITGATTVCTNTNSIPYSIVAVPNTSSYTWTPPAGATIATGQGTTAVTVNFGATTGVANLIVRANGTVCGNSGNRTLAITRNTCPRFEGANVYDEMMLSAYPNPAHDKMNILFNSSSDAKYKLTLTDVQGRAILVKSIEALAGENNYYLNLDKIAAGVYSLSLQSSDANSQLRIIVE